MSLLMRDCLAGATRCAARAPLHEHKNSLSSSPFSSPPQLCRFFPSHLSFTRLTSLLCPFLSLFLVVIHRLQSSLSQEPVSITNNHCPVIPPRRLSHLFSTCPVLRRYQKPCSTGRSLLRPRGTRTFPRARRAHPPLPARSTPTQTTPRPTRSTPRPPLRPGRPTG